MELIRGTKAKISRKLMTSEIVVMMTGAVKKDQRFVVVQALKAGKLIAKRRDV